MENNSIITRGDRIIINNIPEDYGYKDLYIQKGTGQYIGVIDVSIFERGEVVKLPTVGFFTGYLPFLHKREFSLSGCGHSIKRDKLTFIKRDKAIFWKWLNDVPGAGRADNYEIEVNYFSCDFNDIGK